mmetsp:Transcript_45752/g.99372  ORF Transcript_45752/g.99372 Transcript_45752/m.99372 type:complete len:464 (+) Transcript_45752:49-1440(+)
MEALLEWAKGREWAVQTFVGLSVAALVAGLLRSYTEAGDTVGKKESDVKQRAEFLKFQWSYLAVYIVIMLADWLQGTHMYTLYMSYNQSNINVSVGTLFFTGFLAAGILGTFTGPLVDKYGRKNACLVYVVLEVIINLLEHVNMMSLLLVGRVLGGISTSLLFSAFEAWMVTEHRKRGFPEEWIGQTFGHGAVWNGVMAIAAGFLAQVSADWFGDIGPFQLAIALTILAGALILSWRENYGGGHDESSSGDSGFSGAWSAVMGNKKLLLVGSVYALFEGAMYTFVFNWVPTLARALGDWGKMAAVQGLLFSCLMAAISIGGEVYNFSFRIAPVEVIGVVVFGVAAACMAVPTYCDLYGCGDNDATFRLVFVAFLGFEMCVGAFQPCIATHRSKYVPDQLQSTINNLFRFPLNMLVATGTMLSDWFPPYAVFLICAGCHALATVCQTILIIAARQDVKVAPKSD